MKRERIYMLLATVLATVVMVRMMTAQDRPVANATPQPNSNTTNADSEPARPTDKAAIEAASQAFGKAFESGDVKSVAALFTDEGEYVSDDGVQLHGRPALAKAYEGFFAKRPQLKVESKTDAIRFLGADTAIQEGTFTVTAKDTPPDANRFSTLYVRQGGKWLIALMKEWGDDETKKPSLRDLSWLIGTWESDGGDLTARTTYEWTANKSFIRAQYSLTPKKAGERVSSGVQVIGIDPAAGQIRAWLFDSDGGIGESNWKWDGDRWVIESVGTLPDGSRTSAVNFLARSGSDAFTWKSVERTVAGDPEPDIPAVTVKRVVASTAAPKTTR
jgi:uncharacterized protein (TIGR02246 family)